MKVLYSPERTQIQKNYDKWIGKVIDLRAGTLDLDSLNEQINDGLRRNKFAPTVSGALGLQDYSVFTDPYSGALRRPGINCVVYVAALGYLFADGKLDALKHLTFGANVRRDEFHVFAQTQIETGLYDTHLCFKKSESDNFFEAVRQLFDSSMLTAEKCSPYLQNTVRDVVNGNFSFTPNSCTPLEVDRFLGVFTGWVSDKRSSNSHFSYSRIGY